MGVIALKHGATGSRTVCSVCNLWVKREQTKENYSFDLLEIAAVSIGVAASGCHQSIRLFFQVEQTLQKSALFFLTKLQRYSAPPVGAKSGRLAPTPANFGASLMSSGSSAIAVNPMRPLGISPKYIKVVQGHPTMVGSLGPSIFLGCELCDARIKVIIS